MIMDKVLLFFYRVVMVITKSALACRMLVTVWNLLSKKTSVMKSENKEIVYANT